MFGIAKTTRDSSHNDSISPKLTFYGVSGGHTPSPVGASNSAGMYYRTRHKPMATVTAVNQTHFVST